MKILKPKQIVEFLNRHVVAQDNAKKAIAIAYRNRWRRQQITDPNLRDSIIPKNILMMGPTGCGKSEIARQLAKLSNSPFVKVEATQFTEIGYHGNDVQDIIRQLMKSGLRLVKEQRQKNNPNQLQIYNDAINQYIYQCLFKNNQENKEQRMYYIEQGLYDSKELQFKFPFNFNHAAPLNALELLQNFNIDQEDSQSTEITTVNSIKLELLEFLKESNQNEKDLFEETRNLVESQGIVIIDEIDKIAEPSSMIRSQKSPSGEGVQRDLLPIIEGTNVQTKWGDINTNHILFICAGAFHSVKVNDLMPELLGRLPIRIQLQSLKKKEYKQILTDVENNLLKQQIELFKTEGMDISFNDEAIDKLCELAEEINRNENYGARRLFQLVEMIVEEHSFDCKGEKIEIGAQEVIEKLKTLGEKGDLRRFLI